MRRRQVRPVGWDAHNRKVFRLLPPQPSGRGGSAQQRVREARARLGSGAARAARPGRGRGQRAGGDGAAASHLNLSLKLPEVLRLFGLTILVGHGAIYPCFENDDLPCRVNSQTLFTLQGKPCREPPTSISGYLVSPFWWARALSRSDLHRKPSMSTKL